MKNFLLPVFLSFFIIFSGCHKKCEPHSKGKLVFPKLDGCGLVIELENKEILEPSNLSDFNVTLKDGQKVFLDYEVSSGGASICMMGTIVDLKYIADR